MKPRQQIFRTKTAHVRITYDANFQEDEKYKENQE